MTHTTATLLDNLYVKCKQLDNHLAGVLTVDLLDHFPVFLLIGKNITKTSKKSTFQYRNIDTLATQRIKCMLQATDWSCLSSLQVDDQYKLFTYKVNEYIDIWMPMGIIQVAVVTNFFLYINITVAC